jgi:hypothetical protein
MDLGHWNFDTDFNIDDWFGFIYRIIEKSTGKEYIGKKQFHSKKRKIVKGKKNRKVIISESNWRTYRSSSDELKARIEEFGEDNYIFIIETLHRTKGGLSYAEIEAQVTEDALRVKNENGERKFYNKCIGNIKFIPPDKSTAQPRKTPYKR